MKYSILASWVLFVFLQVGKVVDFFNSVEIKSFKQNYQLSKTFYKVLVYFEKKYEVQSRGSRPDTIRMNKLKWRPN